jgi:AcrR family transcriptional regulator
MPVISAKRMQDRADSILRAAKTVFSEKGYEGSSIADIARAADVSDGLVYRYFRNKRDLLYHVLRVFYERILVDLERHVMAETTFEAQLRELIRRHLSVFIADTDLCRLFISEVRVASDYHGSAIQELNRAYTSVLIKIVDQAVAAGTVRGDINPRLLRDIIFGAIEHRAWRFVNSRGALDVEETTDELTALLTRGLLAPPARRRAGAGAR